MRIVDLAAIKQALIGVDIVAAKYLATL